MNVKAGMGHIHTPFGGFMDADLATSLPEIFKVMLAFAEAPEADVVIGDRWSANPQNGEGRNPIRRAMSLTFNRLTQYFSVEGIKDTQAGFKFFRATALHAIFDRQKVPGFAFDVEILVLCEKMGFKIMTMPILWNDVAGSTVNPLVDSLRMMRELVRIRRLVDMTLGQMPFTASP